jgi:hypothetical protein
MGQRTMPLQYPQLHSWHHEDYEIAKQDIYRQIGDVSEFRLLGRQVLCAIYVRPLVNILKRGQGIEWRHSEREQGEDISQGKSLFILTTGPSAFKTDDEDEALDWYSGRPPKIGDWVCARAAVGEAIQICCTGAERVLFTDTNRREPEPQYAAFVDGWPCRILMDRDLIAVIALPHHVV